MSVNAQTQTMMDTERIPAMFPEASGNVRAIAFAPDHFHALDLKPDPGQEAFMGSPQKDELLERAMKSPSFTIMVGTRPVACMGLLILWPGVAEGWAFVANDIRRYSMSFLKTAFWIIEQARARNNLHRIQAVVHEDFKTGQKFMKHLGFYPEAKLVAYGPDGANYMLYARILWHQPH